MSENKLSDMSTEFSVNILNLTDGIKEHYSLANQLKRAVQASVQTSERRRRSNK